MSAMAALLRPSAQTHTARRRCIDYGTFAHSGVKWLLSYVKPLRSIPCSVLPCEEGVRLCHHMGEPRMVQVAGMWGHSGMSSQLMLASPAGRGCPARASSWAMSWYRLASSFCAAARKACRMALPLSSSAASFTARSIFLQRQGRGLKTATPCCSLKAC